MPLFIDVRSTVLFLSLEVLCLAGSTNPLLSQVISAVESVEHRSPPEFGFYEKDVSCNGIALRGSAAVRDQALSAICAKLDKMLARQDLSRRNMMQRGVELHVVAAKEE